MAPTRVPTMSLRSGRTLLVVTISLFGLFAMHGWGTHGTSAHGSAGMPRVSAAAERTSVHLALHEHSDSSHPGDTNGSAPAPGHDTGLLALCLAVLGAWIAIVVPLLRRHVTLAPPAQLRYGPPAAPRIRDRDPPDLLALGVIRC